MLGTCASDATSADLAAIADVLTKQRDIFVINVSNFVTAELAWLLLKFLIKCRCLCALIFWFFERTVITCSIVVLLYGCPALAGMVGGINSV